MKLNQSSSIDSNQSKLHPAWRSSGGPTFVVAVVGDGIERGEERIRGKDKEQGGRRKHVGLLEAARRAIGREREGSNRWRGHNQNGQINDVDHEKNNKQTVRHTRADHPPLKKFGHPNACTSTSTRPYKQFHEAGDAPLAPTNNFFILKFC